ncbi:DUF4157 domain-containing protein [Halovivax cerinus]|uniref:DUF4157 domain-containing protein n=1 Tax=Halovivax cerinus TaxID=1487865 RepID=A0ABD5NMF2_9EURY
MTCRSTRVTRPPTRARRSTPARSRSATTSRSILGSTTPERPEGQHLLAHELAHVRQQAGGANGVRAAD